MVWQTDVRDGLTAADVGIAAYLPDGAVSPLVDELESSPLRTVRVEREESAVAVAAGAWIAGERAVVVCQSSGLANAFNAVGSLALPAQTPFVGVVSRRGALGEFNVAQVPTGYGLPGMLDELGVRNEVVSDPERVGDVVRMAAETAFSTRTPYVVCLDATVTGYKREEAGR